MSIRQTLGGLALLAVACSSHVQVTGEYAGWSSGVITLSDSTAVRFANITGMFVFYGGGKGGVHTTTFPVRRDTGWSEMSWKEIRSVEILQSRYGKIERWPCLLNALVQVELEDGLQVRNVLDCLFWIEVTLQPDQEGKLETRTLRFFTVDGRPNILRIQRD